VSTRHEIEDIWRERLNDAQQSYSLAKVDVQNVVAEMRGLNTPWAFATSNISEALKRENRALSDYMRILQIFSDLVLNQKHYPRKRQAKAQVKHS
jgi:light-regulated signal transduction histidine kinase (bacteriophytochrome)